MLPAIGGDESPIKTKKEKEKKKPGKRQIFRTSFLSISKYLSTLACIWYLKKTTYMFMQIVALLGVVCEVTLSNYCLICVSNDFDNKMNIPWLILIINTWRLFWGFSMNVSHTITCMPYVSNFISRKDPVIFQT